MGKGALLESLDIIANKLNSRPRKTLGFKSPKEMFNFWKSDP